MSRVLSRSLLLVVLAAMPLVACSEDTTPSAAGTTGNLAAGSAVATDIPQSLCGGSQKATCRQDEFCDYAPASACLANASGVCRKRPTECPIEALPVCGCDGANYASACEAHRAGVDDAYGGKCRDGAPAPGEAPPAAKPPTDFGPGEPGDPKAIVTPKKPS